MQVWRHEHTFLSAPADALTLDFSFDLSACGMPGKHCRSTRLQFREAGTCHALLMWIRYDGGGGEDGGEDGGEPWCDTGPSLEGRATPHFQGIRYLERALAVREGERLTCIAEVDRAAGLLCAKLVQ